MSGDAELEGAPGRTAYPGLDGEVPNSGSDPAGEGWNEGAGEDAPEGDRPDMELVDELIDKAQGREDDAAGDEGLDDSEFEDDIQLDNLDDFMSDDPDDVDELIALDESEELVDPELGDDFEDTPKSASAQAAQARKAIEERAERRRIDRDLNYLDFELDD